MLQELIGQSVAFVFSHPNHELAVFGAIQRFRPQRIVYLTDGGAAARVEQTVQGLSSIGLLDRAVFLNHSESSFYQALLAVDLEFYVAVAEQVREQINAVTPCALFCDAVQQYNPVHDLALPVSKFALRDLSQVPLVEIPLVYQSQRHPESYSMQRAPRSLQAQTQVLTLTKQELEAKAAARDSIYTILLEDLGSLLRNVSKNHAALEEFIVVGDKFPALVPDRVLRYEQRGKLLKKLGRVTEVICRDPHFVPIAEKLWSAA